MMIRKVSANTSSSLRSIPGSCCGLLNSAKSVSSLLGYVGTGASPVQAERSSAVLDRVVPALGQRMTPQQPPTRHQSATHRAMPLDRFHRVFRTSRHIPARRRKRWRNPPFVKSQQPQRQRLHLSTSFSVAAPPFRALCGRVGSAKISLATAPVISPPVSWR